MLKKKNFDEKINKFKKIYIYPRNNSIKKENHISNFKINNNSKRKFNISNFLLDNNITRKNKSFLIYKNSITSSNKPFEPKNKLSDFNFSSFRRNKSCIKESNLFIDNNKENKLFDNKYEEILKELRYIKQNNKSININININNDFQTKNKIKSKSVKNGSSLSSQKNLFENDKNILKNQEKENIHLLNNFNKIKDMFINNITDILNNDNNLKIRNTSNNKYNKEENDNKDKNVEKEYLSLENNRKIKYLNKINTEGNEKKFKKSNVKKITTKLDKIKCKINHIIKERSKSTQKNFNNNISHINTEEKHERKYFIDSKENIQSNYYKINNTFNNENYKNYNKNKNEDDSFIIKERYLDKNNYNKNTNNLLFNEETDNQVLNWINKEKINDNYKVLEKTKNFLFYENINYKNFNNYQISNKYFKNNEPFMKYRKPIKSLNFGDYFDLELNKFNSKLNNYNIKNNTNIITSKHVFKPIY